MTQWTHTNTHNSTTQSNQHNDRHVRVLLNSGAISTRVWSAVHPNDPTSHKSGLNKAIRLSFKDSFVYRAERLLQRPRTEILGLSPVNVRWIKRGAGLKRHVDVPSMIRTVVPLLLCRDLSLTSRVVSFESLDTVTWKLRWDWGWICWATPGPVSSKFCLPRNVIGCWLVRGLPRHDWRPDATSNGELGGVTSASSWSISAMPSSWNVTSGCCCESTL